MDDREPLTFLAPVEAYRRLAERLSEGLAAGDEAALWRCKWAHPRFRDKTVDDVRAAALDLADAQAVVAREYAFDDWPALEEFARAVCEEGAVARFETAVEAVIAGDVAALHSSLNEEPELIRARSLRRHRATLLHYVAANGVETHRQRTPPNAVEVAKTLLANGAEADALAHAYEASYTTLNLLVSSSPPADAGLQAALAETLLDYGAAVEGDAGQRQSPLLTALAFGFLDTAHTLVRRGAAIADLAVAAGLGRLAEATRLLPTADERMRHAALALAAQHGHVEVVRLLLDAGEDPNRFNPPGFHGHSTPLHQAAWGDHLPVVQLLVERGARRDLRDALYRGTPRDWAAHGGRTASVAYLQALDPPTR